MALQKKAESWKMKKWYAVHAPKVFNDALVGEMPANDEKAATGRKIVVSLDALTHNPSHAYTNIVLKVTDVEGETAHTKLLSIEQLYSYIRSLVRRYRSIASSVISVSTKDNSKMVLKLLVVTRSRTAHSKISGIRSEMNRIATDYFKESEADSAISAVLDGKFQAELAGKLNHIAPLNKVEVRKLEIAS